ncbi:MAG: hypothetical protein KAR03_12415 [Candidatus Thorarchaeota archaeon]|nr:hypothetical protein [Candidatus Thorarchaeota archaeon]
MSQNNTTSPVETGKILGSIYGSLIILFAILLFLSTLFSGLPTDAALRSFFLILAVGGFIILIGAELARVLFKSGVTIVGFFGFLSFNLLIVLFGLAVYVDIVVPTVMDTTIQMVIFLLLASLVWYVVLVILLLRDWRKK